MSFCCIILNVLREWRNWQTRTFEGRVVLPYGFNSRLPHQKAGKQSLVCFSFCAGDGEAEPVSEAALGYPHHNGYGRG